MLKLKRMLREKKYWSDRDKNRRTASKILFSKDGKSTLVDDDEDLQDVCKSMEREHGQMGASHPTCTSWFAQLDSGR